jgi:hypothetical protein
VDGIDRAFEAWSEEPMTALERVGWRAGAEWMRGEAVDVVDKDNSDNENDCKCADRIAAAIEAIGKED